MTSRSWEALSEDRRRRKLVLTIPQAPSDFPVASILTKFHTQTHEIWQVISLIDLPLRDLARVLALSLLDDVESVLPAPLMPTRPTGALFLKNGQIRQPRGFVLAPWVLAETDRVATALLQEQRQYLEQVAEALRQGVTADFRPVTPGMVFADTIFSMRFGPVPDRPNIDLHNCERVKWNLKWFQIVSQDYTRNRYLTLLSREQLGRRVEDILANIHVLDPSGLVSLDQTDPLLNYWFARLTEVQTEMAMRNGPYPAGWQPGMIDFSNMPRSLARAGPEAAVRLKPASGLPELYVVKYGRREFLESALHTGRIRLAPASLYKDASLNPSVRDDELTAEIWYDPTVPFNELPPGTMILPPGRVPYRRELHTNYYVYCLADHLSTRLLFDFEADCCMVIREPEAFVGRMEAAAKRALAHWSLRVGRVEYFDPLQVNPAEIDVLTWKHFRYAYQNEVRLIWLPPTAHASLSPVFLELGKLDDIAELVVPTTAKC